MQRSAVAVLACFTAATGCDGPEEFQSRPGAFQPVESASSAGVAADSASVTDGPAEAAPVSDYTALSVPVTDDMAGCVPVADDTALSLPVPNGFAAPPPAWDGPWGAASCPVDGVFWGSISIQDQQGLDTLAGCERITGNLSLTLFPGIDETPLLSLRDVEGGLWIYPSLEIPVPNPLEGFANLEEAREVFLNRLTLSDLEPLGRLRRIGVATSGPDFERTEGVWHDASESNWSTSRPGIVPGLTVLACPGLSSLAGLDALEEVDGIELTENTELVSLAGLPSLTELAQLQVMNCPLRDLEGIESLGVADLFIYASALTSLSGLGNAQRLRRLTLSQNAELESLEGGVFPSSMDYIWLLDNHALASTAGMEDLHEVGTLILESARVPFALQSLEGLSGLEQATELRVLKQGTLSSLAGLEALRRVQTLELSQNFELTNVQALSGVQSVGEFLLSGSSEVARLPSFGSASVARMQLYGLGITDLAGLEQVQIADSLVVGGMATFSSLRGLPQLSAHAQLGLDGLSALNSVAALEGVTALGALSIVNTALADLDALGALRQLGSLQLYGNAQLVQLDALSQVNGLRMLEVSDHPLLRSVPTFSNVSASNVSANRCEVSPGFVLRLWNNPALQAGPGLPLLERAQVISVVSNDALLRLSGLSSLRSVESLRIAHNSALTELDLPRLEQVVQVGIYGNTALEDTPLQRLAQVAAQQALIVSNASGPALLDPCPWPEDGVCDEITGACASGADLGDCP